LVEDQILFIRELKKYAKDEKVPIIQDESLSFLLSYIQQMGVKRILEIGSAIGYSAIRMAMISKDIHIVTIEKDQKRYLEALKNIKKCHLEDQITLIYKDALEVNLKEQFDLIFIDAAKGKNMDFFNHFEKYLDMDGTIITDNISFHGYVAKELKEIENRNLRSLVKKIKNYILFLENHVEYKTVFYDVGDGLAVTKKRL